MFITYYTTGKGSFQENPPLLRVLFAGNISGVPFAEMLGQSFSKGEEIVVLRLNVAVFATLVMKFQIFPSGCCQKT
jgi:hypothetical protein